MRLDTSTCVNVVSAIAAVAAACIATWQTFEARSATREAYKFALSSERLESCMTMDSLGHAASMTAMNADLMNKPYRENARFIQVVMAIDRLGDETVRFREMTPGESSDDLFNKSWGLRIYLKDMVADGGDYLTQEEIRESIRSIEATRRDICERMLAPKGGF